MGVATGGWGMAIEGCMHVVVCFVFPHLFLYWQLAFASPRSLDCMNVTICLVFPSLLLSLQMAFASLFVIHNKPKKHPSNPMYMHNALYFQQHTCTKKSLSLSGYCVPVKCCMFLVSRITVWLGTDKG